jgi:hypothetical protein
MTNDFALNDITRCLTQAEASEAKECQAKGYPLAKIAKQCSLLGKVPALASYLGYTQEQVSSILGGECLTTPEIYFKCIQRSNSSMRSLSPRLETCSPVPLSYLREAVPSDTLYLANEQSKPEVPWYTPYSTDVPHDYDRGEHTTHSLNRAFEIRKGNSGKGGDTSYTPYSGDQSLYFTGGLRPLK